VTSAADGEVLPPTVRRRYAARCFILSDFCRKRNLSARLLRNKAARKAHLDVRKKMLGLFLNSRGQIDSHL
jgi:hypothetical protein